MEDTLPPPLMEEQMCSGTTVRLDGFVEQEESSCMESPKEGSSEWTDEKHSLYLKSMEDSFVNQLYKSLDMQNGKTGNQCSSDFMSSGRLHACNHCPSSQHGFWSRIGSKRKNLVRNEANRPDVSSINTWIQHFRNGNKQAMEEKPSLTSCSDIEVIDQNFAEEDPGVQMINTAYKKRTTTYVVPE